MKTFLLSLLTLLSISFLSASETKIWNRNWEFKRGDATTWQTCHLPHSFSAPYFLGQDFYTGDGFYRKTLLPEMYGNAKNVFLDFEGAFQFVEVFLDGVRVGEHRSGYTGFRVNLTPALKRHQAQELSVRVNNVWDSRTAPRAGEHIFTGGINRDVTLVTEGNVYIERNGITFTTPKVSAEQAIAEVRVEIRNSSSQTQKVHLQTTLHDVANSYPPATVQTRTTQEVLLPPNSCTVATVALPAVNRPKLWSPESPTLYLLAVELRQPKFLGLFGGGRISEKTAEVGFRWFEFTKDKGFFLNGKPLFLMGANVHQDNAGWGDGITNGAHARDVRLMKAAGFNFIRGSHYPHDPAFLVACDRLGLLFWSEGGVWGMGGGTADNRYWATSAVPHLAADREPYAQSAERLVREMIRDAKNHPSVIVWSVSNEPFFLDGAPDNLEVATALIKRLLNVVKEEDPTRPAAVGGAQRGGFDQLGGIIGYNGDGAKIFRNPPGPSIVAEYGSTISKRPGAYAPGWGDFGNDRPAWRSGAAIWCGFDHGSIWESGSRMGIVDYFRIPKRSWYWYRNFLLGTPPPAWAKKGVPAALRLTADKVLLTSCAGQDDAQIMVQFVDDKGIPVDVETPVTFTITEGPGEFPTGRSITFRHNTDIDLREGCAAITFRSNFNGTATITATADGVPPATLTIVTEDSSTTDRDCAFDPKRSRQTPDRPYRGRYQRPAEPKNASAQVADLATHRPCRASSNAIGASAANDGKAATAWKADANDPQPQWTLDLEFIFPLREALLLIPATAPIPTLETSVDGKQFVSVDQAPVAKKEGALQTVTFTFAKNAPEAKYVRIRFADAATAVLQSLTLHSK